MTLAENAFEEADGYIAYIHNPANGYVAQTLPINAGRRQRIRRKDDVTQGNPP